VRAPNEKGVGKIVKKIVSTCLDIAKHKLKYTELQIVAKFKQL